MWNETDTPLAYLISFRTYGSWLHGDQRGSIRPSILNAAQRKSVETAIVETCGTRKWSLLALNVRTNHVHVVVTADTLPERVLNALKANATRQLRADGLWSQCSSPWADKGSDRWLWNEQSVARAVNYVLYGQGDQLPDFDD